ncbi:MAG: alpha-L-fucosidase, partial [Proteobacteria bacterium]|nr:alpha-L-fucosidase [Pseudomonadota bacterium]
PENGEGIYGTRPWKVYGEGPSMRKQEKGIFGGVKDVRPYEAFDIRFTSKGDTLYAFCMISPTDDIIISSLGKNSTLVNKIVKSVSLLGSNENLQWKQEGSGLIISKPVKLPSWQVPGFKIEFKK